MFSSPFSSAARWLQLFSVACLAALLVACGGGGGGGSLPVSVDGGSADNQPWKAVFNGASNLTYNASQCTGSLGSTSTAVITLTRGTNTFVASVTSGTLTLGPFTVGDDSAFWSYGLSVRTGTNTQAELFARTNDMRLDFYNDTDAQQYVEIYDYVTDGEINCAQVTNPLTRAQINLQPQVRIASFLAGTPTGTVNSADILPSGCNLNPGGGGTFTYAISPQGVTQFNGQTLSADWLNTVNDTSAYYYEYVDNYPGSARYSGIDFTVDSAYRGVYLTRYIYNDGNGDFNHYCGGD